MKPSPRALPPGLASIPFLGVAPVLLRRDSGDAHAADAAAAPARPPDAPAPSGFSIPDSEA